MTRNAPETRAMLRTAAVLAAGVLICGFDPAVAADRKRQQEPEPAAVAAVGPARLAVVSLARQRVSFYDAEGGVIRAPVSSGQSGMDTPVGVYSVLQKKVDHTSNIYDDAKMPFMQRITWSGVALHAGALPGYPASHGCVRLPIGFAEQIFDKTRIGLRVVIAKDDIAPVAIEHPLLFQPRPLSGAPAAVEQPAPLAEGEPEMMPDVTLWPARLGAQSELRAVAAEKTAAAKLAAEAAEPLKAPFEKKAAEHKKFLRTLKSAEAEKKDAEKRLARAEAALAAAKKPKAQESAEKAKAKAQAALEKAETKLQPLTAEASRIEAELAAVKSAFDTAEAARADAAAAARDARRKLLPVSVFVSLSTGRLYVRQGHSPVMDVPVEVRDPDTPIGTHIFTALDYANDANTVRWNVVSLPRSEEVGGDGYGYGYGYGYEDTDDEFAEFNRRRRKKEIAAASATEVPVTNAAAAAAALERIVIPQDLRERLAEFVWPGSSLIVSDEPMHKKETNNYTDFVVLLSGYPQGGIKKRPPPPSYYYYDDAPFASLFSPSPYSARSSYQSRYGQPRPRYKKQPSLFSWW